VRVVRVVFPPDVWPSPLPRVDELLLFHGYPLLGRLHASWCALCLQIQPLILGDVIGIVLAPVHLTLAQKIYQYVLFVTTSSFRVRLGDKSWRKGPEAKVALRSSVIGPWNFQSQRCA